MPYIPWLSRGPVVGQLEHRFLGYFRILLAEERGSEELGGADSQPDPRRGFPAVRFSLDEQHRFPKSFISYCF
jgi:hypothetical protein